MGDSWVGGDIGGLHTMATKYKNATDVLDHTFHEHWSEDVHDHGVVGGVLHGAGNVASETAGDVGRLGKDVWHGVTSIF